MKILIVFCLALVLPVFLSAHNKKDLPTYRIEYIKGKSYFYKMPNGIWEAEKGTCNLVVKKVEPLDSFTGIKNAEVLRRFSLSPEEGAILALSYDSFSWWIKRKKVGEVFKKGSLLPKSAPKWLYLKGSKKQGELIFSLSEGRGVMRYDWLVITAFLAIFMSWISAQAILKRERSVSALGDFGFAVLSTILFSCSLTASVVLIASKMFFPLPEHTILICFFNIGFLVILCWLAVWESRSLTGREQKRGLVIISAAFAVIHTVLAYYLLLIVPSWPFRIIAGVLTAGVILAGFLLPPIKKKQFYKFE